MLCDLCKTLPFGPERRVAPYSPDFTDKTEALVAFPSFPASFRCLQPGCPLFQPMQPSALLFCLSYRHLSNLAQSPSLLGVWLGLDTIFWFGTQNTSPGVHTFLESIYPQNLLPSLVKNCSFQAFSAWLRNNWGTEPHGQWGTGLPSRDGHRAIRRGHYKLRYCSASYTRGCHINPSNPSSKFVTVRALALGDPLAWFFHPYNID